MGILCSTIDKEGDDPTEGKAHVHQLPSAPGRFLKMPQFFGHSTRSQQRPNWKDAIEEREFVTTDDYNKARDNLEAAEKERSFDQEVYFRATDREKRANDIVRRLRNYDRDHTYGKSQPGDSPEGKRTEGQHFLGSVQHIQSTELFKVARRMPKGAHLHIHFNSCLRARFLIEQARDIKAMYIRSTLPLTAHQYWVDSRISFSVLTTREATHVKDTDGVERDHGLGDIFQSNYESNRWMSYQDFQSKFIKYEEDDRTKSITGWGTKGAEDWLEQKMLISEEEAHGTQQTGKG